MEERINSFGDCVYGVTNELLAQAGFFLTDGKNTVKCFTCHSEINVGELKEGVCATHIHKLRNPNCEYAKKLVSPWSKVFDSYDSLLYESVRRETFIGWSIDFLDPFDLAREGFYFLRTGDHCACVFCRGIIGGWTLGDTPKGEHQRHFPHCPYLRGQPVGNVPMEHCNILPVPVTRRNSSYNAENVYQKLSNLNVTGPKRKDFLTEDSRLKSYDKWQELVSQKPPELAKAGFFYCGLSDHVLCFHCGNGIRNWENGELPWVEHARWYPECVFVHINKGRDFVEDVLASPYTSVIPTVNTFIEDWKVDILLGLDITTCAIKTLSFPRHKIKVIFRCKIETTGRPFFTIEACIEEFIKYMEEETRASLPERAERAKVLESEPEPIFGDLESGEHCSMEGSPPKRLRVHDNQMCKESDMETVFLPCRHPITRSACATAVSKCPLC